MIDHFSLPVTDFDRSRAFYDAVLATLGYRPLETEDLDEYVACGYGANAGEPPFWIGAGKGPDAPPVPQPGQHIAFRAPDRAAVDAFHRAAMATGGTDNGAPGLRPHYHQNYYAAYVIDPDGYHVEAVCHVP